MERDDVVQIIKETAKDMFGTKIVGDTPTDANQLVPKQYVDGRINMGHVAANGTGSLLPTNWTSVKTATGVYTVTHNIGDSNYVVLLTPDVSADQANNVIISVIFDYGSAAFKANLINVVGPVADKDMAFFFMLVKQPS